MSSSDSPTPTSATDPTTYSSPSSRWGCWDSSGAGWHPYPFVPWWFMVAQLPVAGIVFALEGVLPGAGDAKFMRNAGPDLLVREATAPTATSGSAGTPANAAKAEPPRRKAGRRQSRNPRYRRHGRGWRRRQRRRTVQQRRGRGRRRLVAGHHHHHHDADDHDDATIATVRRGTGGSGTASAPALPHSMRSTAPRSRRLQRSATQMSWHCTPRSKRTAAARHRPVPRTGLAVSFLEKRV